MDTTQLLLTVVISITTVLLTIVGIQLIFVLKELRKTLIKTNAVIDNLEQMSTAAEQGMEEFSGFFTGFKTLSRIIEFVHSQKNGKR